MALSQASWFLNNFVLGFLHFTAQYNMLRELGLAVLVRGVQTRSPVVAVGSLSSSHHWSFSSSVNSSQAGRPYCGHRNPPARGAETFHLTPSHSSSLPSSFDYRREPILQFSLFTPFHLFLISLNDCSAADMNP